MQDFDTEEPFLVAVIDGIRVYSDKCNVTLHNDILYFDDGSYVDLNARSIVNNGEGFISFDSVPPTIEIVNREYFAVAEAVHIPNVTVPTVIKEWHGADIKVTLSGSARLADKVVYEELPKILTIILPDHVNTGNRVTITSSVMISGSIISNNVFLQSNRPGIALLVEVPSGTKINLGNLHENITVDCPNSVIHVENSGDGDLTLTDAQHVYLNLSGDGDVIGGVVSGLLSAIYEAPGDGDITFEAVNTKLLFSSLRDGDFTVMHLAAQDVQISSFGDGDVNLGTGNIGSLNVHFEGDGDMKFKGTSERCFVVSSGDGDLRLGSCLSQPIIADWDGDGDLKFANWKVKRKQGVYTVIPKQPKE